MNINKWVSKSLAICIALTLIFSGSSSIALAFNIQDIPVGLSSVNEAKGNLSEIILPTIEQIHSKNLYNRLINNEVELSDMSSSDLLLTIAQTAYELQTHSAEAEELEYFVPITYSVLIPIMQDSDFVKIIGSTEYPDSFRWYFSDFYNSFRATTSQEFEAMLVDVITDTTEDDMFRSRLALDMCVTSENQQILTELYEEVDEDVKPAVLKSMYHTYPEEAKNLAISIMQNYTNETKELVIYADKVFAVTLGTEEAEKNLFFDINRTMLQSEDAELVEQCLYALSDVKLPEAVSLVFEEADFTNFGIKGFVEENLELVTNYLDTASFADIERCITAVPLLEFTPYLEKYENNNKTAGVNSLSVEKMYEAIKRYNTPINDSTRAVASGLQGLAAYRDGVGGHIGDIWSGVWHGAIVNDPNAQGSQAFIQASGPSTTLDAVDNARFLDGNTSQGYRKFFDMTQRDYNEVLTTARELEGQTVYYCFDALMRADLNGLSHDLDIIDPSRITQMRCDGVVEYCFEYNGMWLQTTSSQQDAWDISIKLGYWHGHNPALLTPYTQSNANYFRRVDG